MHSHADKASKDNSTSERSSRKETSVDSALSFSDNRPEAALQRKLQEAGDNSPMAKQTAQLKAAAENKTGLPDQLKNGVEQLSGHSLDDVKVHYNSAQPATLQAHAYAQGTDIHVAPGQEKHLPHEAWHVVQQKQGRVKPTVQLKGNVPVNDDSGLEHEADVMGAKALNVTQLAANGKTLSAGNKDNVAQLATNIKHTTDKVKAKEKGKEGDGYQDHTVGISMEAHLEPNDAVKGSATGVNSTWMQWIRAQYPAANVVRGHLLNHDLGGFGIEENLYPISTKANADHSSKVEQHVKGALTSAKASNGHVDYSVTVNQKGAGEKTYSDAEFECEWTEYDSAGDEVDGNTETIPSNLGTDKGGFGGGSRGNQSPTAWRHGTSKGGTEVNAVRDRLDKAVKGGKVEFDSIPDLDIDMDEELSESEEQDVYEQLFDLVEEYGYDAVLLHFRGNTGVEDFLKLNF